ncbi:MAG: MATE family efflux transporter [Rhodospirillales bacterium]|jgi:multidrug resistance protein, MATE family|nr:MATE family efflux transporter [Rhodospirillales bacterium]MBT4040587.1 MATE family efflux transporter [Rhodospirillales bacterium]MBT4627433.1 MATE family efflux transporter [Rhodospirillales bacterium]MBT5353374.1 MATE family efflux transporter [Rhodospirillales bacterium]MBT5522400.1 MATE family efflux transporter [Rhodospirillales bacterium]
MKLSAWNKTIWLLAGPIMLSNISVPLLGIVDTAVVGQLPGAHYIGAVAVGAQIFAIIYWGFGFLRMGTSGFTAQALGAGDLDEVRAYLLRGFVLSIVVGVAAVVLQAPILWACMMMIGASEQVSELAEAYYSIRIWGAPFVFMGYVLLGWFVGIQNTIAILLLQMGMNLLNITLDLVFVLEFGWGVEGVAYATVISEVSAAVFGCWLAFYNANKLGGAWRTDLVKQWDKLKQLLLLNRDILLRTLCLEAAFVTVTALGARMGDTVLAANSVLFLFFGLMAYGLDGFAHAIETLAGHAYGARDRDRFRGAVYASSLWAAVFSVPFCLVFWFFGGEIIDLLSATPSVRMMAREYLIWIAILPLISVWSFLLDGVFFGMTRGPDMRNAMIISLMIFTVSVVVLVEQFANHGIWMAMTIFMIARAVTLGWKYPALERLFER